MFFFVCQKFSPKKKQICHVRNQKKLPIIQCVKSVAVQWLSIRLNRVAKLMIERIRRFTAKTAIWRAIDAGLFTFTFFMKSGSRESCWVFFFFSSNAQTIVPPPVVSGVRARQWICPKKDKISKKTSVKSLSRKKSNVKITLFPIYLTLKFFGCGSPSLNQTESHYLRNINWLTNQRERFDT